MERKDDEPRGLWLGLTAPPWRIGPWAPDRWPAKQPIELPPFEFKRAQALASLLVANGLRLSNDPCAKQRLRDVRAHRLERRRHSGSYFRADLDGIEKYRRHDQLRWFLEFKVNDKKLDFSARTFEHRSVDGETGIIIPKNSDAVVGVGIDSNIANQAGLKFEEVDSTVERRRRKYGRPLRERKKPGRKPIGLVAMTTAERMRKYRRNKVLKRPLPTGVTTAGTEQPLPLGPTVPVDLSMKKAQAPTPNGRRRPGADQRGLPPSLPVLGGSSRISTPSSGVVMITPVPTPQQGAQTIPPLSERDVTVIVLALERHARAVRAREAKRSVLAWRAARAAAQSSQA
jgi:hypothetical protein